MIQEITTDALRRTDSAEGLILQGCGGDPQEWLDGINKLLTDAGILRNGSKFEHISVFKHDGVTCLLFPFAGVDLDVGKLALWRLETHGQFGGTWLSDYVPNRLGGYIEKPDCPLIGADGNVFNLMGIARKTLRSAGQYAAAKEMSERVMQCGSYEDALCVIAEYVNVIGTDEEEGLVLE